MQNSHNATTSSSPPSPTTGVPACASCRHQRKKCTEKCILAPFFPAEKTQEFQAVHKVFGVSNVTKLVKDLSREDGKKAADSLIWEANCRLNDPVLGPLGEFQRVCEELKYYKSQYSQNQVANINNNLRQVPVAQGAVLYHNKSAQNRLIGSWNNGDHHNNGNVSNGSMLSYIDNTRMFNYGALQNMEKLKQERDEQQGSLIHPQQQMLNDFSQFY